MTDGAAEWFYRQRQFFTKASPLKRLPAWYVRDKSRMGVAAGGSGYVIAEAR